MNGNGSGVQEGVVIVVREADRFLMIQRAAGILAGGAWCFVGGGIEAGETQAEAAGREFAEEVGGEVDPLEKVWEWHRPDGGLVLHWWHCRRRPGALLANPAEVAALGWYDLRGARALPDLLDSNRVFLDSVAGGIRSFPVPD